MVSTQLRSTRRSFLKGAAAGYPVLRIVAAPWVIPASAIGGEGRPAPSNRIAMGFVGVGAQGTGDMGEFMGFPEVQNVAVCDVDRRRRERAQQLAEQRYAQQKAGGAYKGCAAYVDFRELCARPDIDGVFCGTPDHWHALVSCEAMRNGKDVYCEKPETLTIREGRVLIDTARRFGRVFSGGSQSVIGYNWFQRMIWSGSVGEVKEMFVPDGPTAIGNDFCPAEPVPEWLDWEMFLGPAPWRPYNSRYHGFWRGCRDFAGGYMTDMGPHHVGGALFAAKMHDRPLAIEAIPPGKEAPEWTVKFANGVLLHLGGVWGDGGLSYIGTRGELPDRSGRRVAPPKMTIPGYKGRGGIVGDFLHCVKTRERPFRDIEIAHRTMVVCHVANIANWVGRGVKFDPVKEEIVGDEEANRWIDRPRRAPWAL